MTLDFFCIYGFNAGRTFPTVENIKKKFEQTTLANIKYAEFLLITTLHNSNMFIKKVNKPKKEVIRANRI